MDGDSSAQHWDSLDDDIFRQLGNDESEAFQKHTSVLEAAKDSGRLLARRLHYRHVPTWWKNSDLEAATI